MEGTKRRAANSLGMFDLLKGVGMLTIVFAHTGELYPMGDASHINPLTFCMFAYRESLMAAFYIASGYGFRKRSIGKCIDQQFKTLLRPYIYTGIATTVFHFIIHYSLFGSLHNATYETYKVLGGFALGLPHTATYFGQLFFSCGPMWYLLSLMIAWVLLDLILNIFPEQYINWAVLGTMLSIKPVMHTDNEGRLTLVGKARGRKASLKALLDAIERLAIEPEKQTMFICHADCEEEAKQVAAEIQRRFGTTDIRIHYIGPVIGSHTGPNTMGLFFVGTER